MDIQAMLENMPRLIGHTTPKATPIQPHPKNKQNKKKTKHNQDLLQRFTKGRQYVSTVQIDDKAYREGLLQKYKEVEKKREQELEQERHRQQQEQRVQFIQVDDIHEQDYMHMIPQMQEEGQNTKQEWVENDLLLDQDVLRAKQIQERERLGRFVDQQVEQLKERAMQISRSQAVSKQEVEDIQGQEQKLNKELEQIIRMQQIRALDRQYNKMVCNIRRMDQEYQEEDGLRESQIREEREEEERKNESIFREVERLRGEQYRLGEEQDSRDIESK